MGKKHLKPTYNGIVFDSEDEIQMMKWCEEAKNNGFIKDFIYHPEPFSLSDFVYEHISSTKILKTKTIQETKRRTLLQPCTYKPDFVLIEPIPFIHKLFRGVSDEREVLIDIKGSFCVQTAQMQVFSIVRKWVYQKYEKFVNKVIIKDFFTKTFAPESVRIGKSGKMLSKFKDCPSLEDFKKRIEIESATVKEFITNGKQQ